MKKGLLSLFLLSLLSRSARKSDADLLLWYDKPAASWNEALPLGNGRLGAMCFGGADAELLQLNDNTLYSGEPKIEWEELDISSSFDTVVGMLRAEQYTEANAFVQKNWLERLHQNYQPLGDLHLRFNSNDRDGGEITDYRRELDIANSLLTVSYRRNGALYTHEYFASHPD
ncbi:MAG: glycoside hydrolase family 95 protein, partial [Bacteroidales bacterium]|nr:glycoside hydrolase family 95 protein [Bacteroidales bacterium]